MLSSNWLGSQALKSIHMVWIVFLFELFDSKYASIYLKEVDISVAMFFLYLWGVESTGNGGLDLGDMEHRVDAEIWTTPETDHCGADDWLDDIGTNKACSKLLRDGS